MFVLPVPLGPVREFIFGENSALESPEILEIYYFESFQVPYVANVPFFTLFPIVATLCFFVYIGFTRGLNSYIAACFREKTIFFACG